MLYAFQGGGDGAHPYTGLLADQAGNFYGTAQAGGTGCGDVGCGVVFKLAPDGTETVLYAFAGGTDGSEPSGALITDQVGNFYGTTFHGGTDCNCGTVFKLTPDGSETVLYAFTGGSDGALPEAALIFDKKGNLYGTAGAGGSHEGFGCVIGCGVVFKLTPDGIETALHTFGGPGDGIQPSAELIRDKAGNLYGSTYAGGGGGCNGYGCGTVFKIAKNGIETVLHAFAAGSDGALPITGLIRDEAGNLYGTTYLGGTGNCTGNVNGCGIVFKLAPNGTEAILHTFTGGSDGALPGSGLFPDLAGNLYGTTAEGGGNGCNDSLGCGVVFSVAPDGTETVLHAFVAGTDGANPIAKLINAHRAKRLFGTTFRGGGTGCGGTGCGTVFVFKR